MTTLHFLFCQVECCVMRRLRTRLLDLGSFSCRALLIRWHCYLSVCKTVIKSKSINQQVAQKVNRRCLSRRQTSSKGDRHEASRLRGLGSRPFLNVPHTSWETNFKMKPQMKSSEDMKYLEALGSYQKAPYAQGIEPDDDDWASSGSTSRRRTDVTGAGWWPKSSTTESMKQCARRRLFVSIEACDSEAHSARARTKGYKGCTRRQQQFSFDTCGRAKSVLLRPGRAKHIRGGAR